MIKPKSQSQFSDSSSGFRLLTFGNWTYTYTPNGDLQTKTDTSNNQLTTYNYDAQGDLRHVGLPDGRSIDYQIDSENRRVGKRINGVTVKRWVYKDQLKPAAEFDGAGTLVARYADGVTVKAGVNYRVVADHLGTPRLLVNSTTGEVAQRIDTDEWGQVTADSSDGFQAFGFAGGIYDSDTGLVRFGARDYDPVAGRWTAKDPIRFAGGQANIYVYVGNDPINLRDPTGLGLWDLCKEVWDWITKGRDIKDKVDLSKSIRKAGQSASACDEARTTLIDKIADGTATGADNRDMENKCGQFLQDINEAGNNGVDQVKDSYGN